MLKQPKKYYRGVWGKGRDRRKKFWGIYNQIRTHSPFCKLLIIKHSQVTHKIENFAVFKGVFSAFSVIRRFKSYRIMQCLKFCHIGGCKNSFLPQKQCSMAHFKYSLNAGKSNQQVSLFCRTPTNAQQRLSVPSFAEIGTRIAQRLIFATWCVIKEIVRNYAARFSRR